MYIVDPSFRTIGGFFLSLRWRVSRLAPVPLTQSVSHNMQNRNPEHIKANLLTVCNQTSGFPVY